MKRFVAVASMLAWGAVAVVRAQPPELSGTWKLNREVSQITSGVGLAGLGAGGAPNSIYTTLAANGTLTIGSDHNQSLARAYVIGGQSTIPAAPSGTVVVGSRWEGRSLVVTSSSVAEGQGAELKETFALSADGRRLSVTVSLTTPEGLKTTALQYSRVDVESPCQEWPTPCREAGQRPGRR